MNRSTLFTNLFRVAQPLSLVAGLLAYALGGGIANYLGQTIDWPVFFIGQGAVTFLQLSSYFLREYFNLAGQDPFRRPAENKPQEIPRVTFLQIAVTTLTAGAVMTVLLISKGVMNLATFVICGTSFVIGIAYAVPPLRLADKGYGELSQAILLTNLFPALGLLLQTGEFHRLLGLLTFPLTLLSLAVSLAQSLRGYPEDVRNNRQTMMVRLGWQRGINFHNILIAAAYLVLVAAFFLGLPWRLAFPVFLTLPVALFEVWQINQIADGGKPRWTLLSVAALATLALAIYLMNLALWTG